MTLEAVGALIVVAVERARAIEHAAKMEATRETEQLKSVLVDALAHDFKTPLTSIKGSATALLMDLGFGRDERKELLILIDEECDHINRLIGSASEMARLDAGQIKLTLAAHSTGALISAALADCQAVLRERRIELEGEKQERLVLADLSLARKVLVHLIENANLYSTPGEPITVRAAQQDRRVAFSVADRGPGIEEVELGRIFEKFYRGKGQRDRVNGTGMGLAIAAAIVRAHGGTIEAVSQPGSGSVFTFYLPIVETPR
jgi:two-component system sensor histidine kinase KdpD